MGESKMLRQKTTKHQKNKKNKLQASKSKKNETTMKADKDNECIINNLFGFSFSDLKSWDNFVKLLYRPTDPSSLGIVRALFGLLMIIDISEERGLSNADIRWGDPDECRFPLFNFLKPLPWQWMCVVYLIMGIGAAGIMLGFFFRLSCLMYAIPYWYIFLLDKTSWNNHSYLFGLISIIFLLSEANKYFSLDAVFWPKENSTVPLWNYAIFRYQLFILYFIAGLKKLDHDWMSGYSMKHLSSSSLFEPFRLFLTSEQIDYWIVHFGGFFLDLTIVFWLFFDQTRLPALLFCSAFHIMNSQLFIIGVFPYVCLVTMPIFCSFDWPKKLLSYFKVNYKPLKGSSEWRNVKLKFRNHLMTVILLVHVILQGFLPYSHFITKGYNNWTNGLYGYSWDMMVHTWNTILVMPRIVDEKTGDEHFLDPEIWVESDRWTKHADMVKQWATCVEKNLRETRDMTNISIYLDVRSSLNGRFQQRMYNPKVNILTAEWSPFESPTWVMPLFSELSSWRKTMNEIEENVFSWSNYTDVLFVADFPGLSMENFIAEGMSNVSLTVLSGQVILEQLKSGIETGPGEKIHLKEGNSNKILENAFHYIHIAASTPACYMYTFTNQTALNEKIPLDTDPSEMPQNHGFIFYTIARYKNFMNAVSLTWNAVLNILFNVPVPKRVKIY